jgi:phosphatidylinositol alpha-1,6-mannosyltransferase
MPRSALLSGGTGLFPVLMDVLGLTPFFPPMVSGAAEYFGDVAVGLMQAGHRVDVVTSQGTGGTAVSGGVVVQSVRSRIRGASSLRMAVAAVAAHRRRNFDVVVAGAAYPNGVVAGLVARLIRRPLVVIAYGEDVSIADRSRLARVCLAHVWRAADKVIAISSFTRDHILRQGGSATSCHLVPPGIADVDVDVSGCAPGQRFRQRHGLTGPVLLTVARLDKRKGHDVVLDAVAQLANELPDLEYVIVGSGDPTVLRASARALGIDGRLTILDHLDQQQLAEAYAGSDVFVMVSRTGDQGEVEGFGIVYLEAAARGLVCIAGNEGGAPDAVVDGVTGFCVDPLDATAVADAIRTLVNNPQLSRTMGVEGRRRVGEQYTRNRMQAATTEIIVTAAAGLADDADPHRSLGCTEDPSGRDLVRGTSERRATPSGSPGRQ